MNSTTALTIGLALALSQGCSKKEEPSAQGHKPVAPAKSKPSDKAPQEAPTGPKVHAEEIDYTADGVTLKGYLAYDENASGPRPGVLVVHEWWGHNDYARMRARMLAEMGYTALAVDMYGDGKQAAHPDDAQKFMKEVLSNIETGEKRFEAAKKLLEGHKTTDPAKTAAIGYCFGGAVVLHMARKGLDLDAVASFHGNLATKAPAQKGVIKAKLLVLHGAADPFVPSDQVDAFKKEMQDAQVAMEFHAYDGAKHAFTNPGATELGKKFSIPVEYDEDADKKSWAELDRFLKDAFQEP